MGATDEAEGKAGSDMGGNWEGHEEGFGKWSLVDFAGEEEVGFGSWNGSSDER